MALHRMNPLNRRTFLRQAGAGFGNLALASLLANERLLASPPLQPQSLATPHFPPRAKQVIFLFMYGGPSHIDLFDPKPELNRWHGNEIPVFRPEDVFMQKKTKNKARRSPFAFQQHGVSGIPICDQYPHLSKHADKLCVIRSLHCESNNHGPALFQMQSGSVQSGHPSMGAWVNYGLGTESQNLPGFVVMMDHQGAPVNGAMNWSAGFLPARLQAVPLRLSGEPIPYLQRSPSISAQQQQNQLNLLQKWNRDYANANPAEEALESRIRSYELAYRMQSAAPEAVDLSKEPQSVREAYGLDSPVTRHFGRNCLLARRLVQRGVRFIQLYSGGNEGPRAWDAHDDLETNHRLHCRETDRPIAALLKDLDQQGLLESTLVLWGGEFGRSPTAEQGKGRDHHARGFTMWMAGGGIRGGTVYGATDEFGYHAIENPVSLPDLHATILHQLGLNHEALTYRFQGRDYRLTDVGGKVITPILT